MSAVPFDTLPDDARLWVFPAARALSADEAAHLLGEVDRFLEGWLAHGRPVHGGRALLEERFLLIGADERATGVSGCSIDTLFRRLTDLERSLGTTLTDVAPVFYRAPDGAVAVVARPEFRRLARDGAADASTPVFDPAVTTVGDLRAGRFETAAGRSWHAKML